MGPEQFTHNVNYYKRTIAHNSLLIYDPEEAFVTRGFREIEKVNDGGQRFPNGWTSARDLEDFLEKDYRTGEVLGWWFGPDSTRPEISYLKGDITEAYSRKVSLVRRSFVFLNLGDADWRVQLSPVAQSREDLFLNAMLVRDRENDHLPSVSSIDQGERFGVLVADRAVLFDRTAEQTDRPVVFTLSESRTWRIFVVDLAEGMWQIRRNGRIHRPSLPVTQGAGVLFFEGPAGDERASLECGIRRSGKLGDGREHDTVASSRRSRELNLFPERTGNSFYRRSRRKTLGTTSVECRVLADILNDHGTKPCDFVKMNCEGAEFEILLSASGKELSRVGTLVVECHDDLTVYTYQDILKHLEDLGFQTSISLVREDGTVVLLAKQ